MVNAFGTMGVNPKSTPQHLRDKQNPILQSLIQQSLSETTHDRIGYGVAVTSLTLTSKCSQQPGVRLPVSETFAAVCGGDSSVLFHLWAGETWGSLSGFYRLTTLHMAVGSLQRRKKRD